MYEYDPEAPIETNIAVIAYIVQDLHTYLKGNGQPGEIAKIHARLVPLEEWKAQITGGLVLAAKIIGGVLALGGLAFAAVKALRGL